MLTQGIYKYILLLVRYLRHYAFLHQLRQVVQLVKRQPLLRQNAVYDAFVLRLSVLLYLIHWYSEILPYYVDVNIILEAILSVELLNQGQEVGDVDLASLDLVLEPSDFP